MPVSATEKAMTLGVGLEQRVVKRVPGGGPVRPAG